MINFSDDDLLMRRECLYLAAIQTTKVLTGEEEPPTKGVWTQEKMKANAEITLSMM